MLSTTQLPQIKLEDLVSIQNMANSGLIETLSDPLVLTEMLLNSEKVHVLIKNIRLRVAKEILFHGPKNEVAIREAIRGKIICASKLKPIIASTRHRLSWAAKIQPDSGLNATDVSNKLQSLVSYIPDHMLQASLALECLKPQYETFKNTPFDYMNDEELGKIMATLSEDDSANLLKKIKTYRELILNYSAGYFELVASIEETRIRSGFTPKKIARLTREVIVAFMSATEKNTDYVLSNDLSMKTTVQLEHVAIQKILEDSTFDYQNPVAFYSGVMGSEALQETLTQVFDPDQSLIQENQSLQRRNIELTNKNKDLKAINNEQIKLKARLEKTKLNKARDAERRENQEKSRKAKILVHRSLSDIYTNGTIQELKRLRHRLGAVDLFQAVSAGNRTLTHKLQSIRGINLNEFFIVRVGEPREAREDETDARCAIMVAADDNREDLIKILLRNFFVRISEKTLAYITSSPSIDSKIKNIVIAYHGKQLLKQTHYTTLTAASSSVTSAIVDKTAVAIIKPEECDDNQIEMAKQYFNLLNQTAIIAQINALIITIESSLAGLKQKSTADASLESFFMSQNFKFNNAKTRFPDLVKEERIIVDEFKKLSMPSAKKSHLKVAKNISLIKKDLADIIAALENKLKSIAPVEEQKDEKKEETRHLSPLIATSSTLFASSTVERENYQTSINNVLEKIFTFTEFTFPDSLDQAEMMTSQNLQLHAILFEIMKLMEIRKKAHPQLAQDPVPHLSTRLYEALLHCKGLIEESPSPDTLQTLTAEVINFSRKLIGAARSNDFSIVTSDSFYLRAHAHGAALEKQPEENTENDSLVYTFSTCGQNLKFSTYTQRLPAGMQYSSLCMVNSKAVIYDGYETPLTYLKTVCAAPAYSPTQECSTAIGKP